MLKIKNKVKLSKLEKYGFVETAYNFYAKTITDTGDRLEYLLVDKTTGEITRHQKVAFESERQLKLTTNMLCIRDLVDLDLIEEPSEKTIEQLKDIEKKCDAYMNMCIAKDDEIETLKCQLKELPKKICGEIIAKLDNRTPEDLFMFATHWVKEIQAKYEKEIYNEEN